MPRNLRQLEADLRRAGFARDPKRGKGSHGWWEHPSGVSVTLSGHGGDDADQYQERDVRAAIAEAARRTKEARP